VQNKQSDCRLEFSGSGEQRFPCGVQSLCSGSIRPRAASSSHEAPVSHGQGQLHGAAFSLFEKPVRAAEEFSFEQPATDASAFSPTRVFDIFINRLKVFNWMPPNSRQTSVKLPSNLLLTPHENFADAVGPVSKSTLRLFEQQIVVTVAGDRLMPEDVRYNSCDFST